MAYGIGIINQKQDSELAVFITCIIVALTCSPVSVKTMMKDLYLHLDLPLNYGGHLGTTDDSTASFLHISLFSTALLDLVNSRPVHSPDVVFPPLFEVFLSALSSSPFYFALQDGFDQT